jgi:hypothetical protein
VLILDDIEETKFEADGGMKKVKAAPVQATSKTTSTLFLGWTIPHAVIGNKIVHPKMATSPGREILCGSMRPIETVSVTIQTRERQRQEEMHIFAWQSL